MAKTHIKKSDRAKTLCGMSSSKVQLAVNAEVATCLTCQNKYKNRKKPGQPKKVTPLELYSHFEGYKQWVKSNPYKKTDFKGKDADEVVYDLEKPLLWVGFKVYLFKRDILANVDEYKANKNGAYKEYTSIIDIIDAEIKEDQHGGASVNLYNGSIISKISGLVDKSEVKTEVKQTLTKIGFADDENEGEENED